MKKFIRLHSLNASNPQNDTAMLIIAKAIEQINSPTEHDLKQREDINAVVILRNGNGYAVKETPDEVLAAIEAAEL